MNEKLKALRQKVGGLLKGLKKVSKKIYIAIAAALVVLIVAAIIIVNMMNSNRTYSVLFTDMTAGETASVLTVLENLGVTDYKVENNDTVLVPSAQAPALTARLLMEGYPQTGYAHSTYYENVGSLSTEAERTQAALFDLEEEMNTVIRNFENVKDAAVKIAPGEDHSYILDSGNIIKASAAVMVTMNTGTKLTNQQATAIRNYVAHAVQGLEIDSVEITDTVGNRYTATDSTVDVDASALKIQLEEEWENKIRTNVMQVLTPFFGTDNVRVSVNCVVEVSQTIEDETNVFLPEWANDGSTDGKGIIGSQIYEYYVTRPDEETVGGLVGSETNSDIPEYVEEEADPDGSELALGGSGQVDYDNSRSEVHKVRTAGYITDCTISVSINSATAGSVNVEEIRQHVARAAGIEGTLDDDTGAEYLADKISVVPSPFYNPTPSIVDPEFPVPMWVIYAAAGGLLLFLVLLLIILRIRKKRKAKALEEAQKREMEAVLAAAGVVQNAPQSTGADVMSMQTERSMELRKDIRQFAEDNPELAAQMVRSWLRGGEENA